MADNQNIESLRNSTVYGNNGEKIGKVGEIYLDDQTNEPTFATVNTGLFGSKETFVPLNEAQASDKGITVPFDKDFVKDAPNIDDDGSLSPEDEQRIYEYYSLDSRGSARGNQATDGRGAQDGAAQNRDAQHGHAGAGNAAAGTAAAGTAAAGTAAAGHDRGADDRQVNGRTDAAGVREGAAGRNETAGRADAGRGAADQNDVVAHEERLEAGNQTERRQTGQVRLRKHVTTDTETVEVPVRREEVQVERTKIDPDSPEARQADRGEAFGEDQDVSVTAYEERPVVNTETVATERVHVGKQAHEETETVSGEVRKEQIEVDEEGDRRNQW